MRTGVERPGFNRFAADYFDDSDLADLQRFIGQNPKSGDVRVLYYVQDAFGRIWLLTVYAKSARENIAVSTLNLLREMADHAEID